jgi:hypothetical protein
MAARATSAAVVEEARGATVWWASVGDKGDRGRKKMKKIKN